MLLLLWIFVGWVTGWLAGKSLEGNGYGPSMDITMGVGGAVVGGLLAHPTGSSGYISTILATLVAMSCAVFFTVFAGLINGRRIYSRQLWEPSVREASKY